MNKKQRRSAGFTLIEVMIALLIVSLALPALVSQVLGQSEGTSRLRDRTYANWVAQNHLAIQQAEYRLTGKFLKGRASDQQEMAGRTWYYEIVSEETEQEGMWRQTVSVGLEQDGYFVSMVGFLNEKSDDNDNSR